MPIHKHLKERNIRIRGNLWWVHVIHQILTSTTYVRWHVFNKLDSKTPKIKDESEWIKIPVLALINQDLFNAASKLQAAHTPKMCALHRNGVAWICSGESPIVHTLYHSAALVV
jgi:hypothetical protein